jgi:hypothetical protein
MKPWEIKKELKKGAGEGEDSTNEEENNENETKKPPLHSAGRYYPRTIRPA